MLWPDNHQQWVEKQVFHWLLMSIQNLLMSNLSWGRMKPRITSRSLSTRWVHHHTLPLKDTIHSWQKLYPIYRLCTFICNFFWVPVKVCCWSQSGVWDVKPKQAGLLSINWFSSLICLCFWNHLAAGSLLEASGKCWKRGRPSPSNSCPRSLKNEWELTFVHLGCGILFWTVKQSPLGHHHPVLHWCSAKFSCTASQEIVLLTDNLGIHQQPKSILKALERDYYQIYNPPSCSHFIRPLDELLLANLKHQVYSISSSILQQHPSGRMWCQTFRRLFLRQSWSPFQLSSLYKTTRRPRTMLECTLFSLRGSWVTVTKILKNWKGGSCYQKIMPSLSK